MTEAREVRESAFRTWMTGLAAAFAPRSKRARPWFSARVLPLAEARKERMIRQMAWSSGSIVRWPRKPSKSVPGSSSPPLAREYARADSRPHSRNRGRSVKSAIVELIEVLCDEAWSRLEAGDQQGYLSEIARKIKESAPEGDVIVLAQASMAGAADLCPENSNYFPILSRFDPGIGLQRAIEFDDGNKGQGFRVNQCHPGVICLHPFPKIP